MHVRRAGPSILTRRSAPLDQMWPHQKNSTIRGKNVQKSDHSHAERRLPQHNGDGVEEKNANVPSRSSQTISIMLTEQSSCSQVVPFGINNRED